jgi:uncharacterized protein HemX
MLRQKSVDAGNRARWFGVTIEAITALLLGSLFGENRQTTGRTMSTSPNQPTDHSAPVAPQDESTQVTAATASPKPEAPQATPPVSQTPPAEAPAPKWSVATAILAILVVFLLVGLAGVTALYVSDKNRSDEQIADQRAQIEKLERDLRGKNNEVNRVYADLDDADACIEAVRRLFTAIDDVDVIEIGKSGKAIDQKCKHYEFP